MPSRDKEILERAIQQKLATKEHAIQLARLRHKQKEELGPKKATAIEDLGVQQGLWTRDQARQLRDEQRGFADERTIGGYRLLEKIGSGSMGSVYTAMQLSLDRVVAVKVLAPHLAHDPEYVERFLREARAVARLTHPNVISGIDAGEADGLRYFVMEYAAGHTVKALLERGGALDPARVQKIGLQIARALRHAHEAGLVHRDVKPDNILVTKDGQAKLCDLGLAKDRPEGGGRSLGTPDYISPEQAEAITEVDIRADLYSLGATLYHMLTGRTPFTGSAQLVMAKHLTEVPTPPSEIDAGIDPALEAVVTRLMEKDRDDRYQTPDDLIVALEGLGKKQAAIEITDSPSAPVSRRRRRRRR